MELTNEEKKTVRVNPFMVPYNTPHDTAPFDRITLADYEEAFMEGIRRDNELIEKTINSTEKPTFDNTILNKRWLLRPAVKGICRVLQPAQCRDQRRDGCPGTKATAHTYQTCQRRAPEQETL